MTETRRVSIDKIRRDDTQTRAGLVRSLVESYAEEMRAGDRFPEPVVFFDGDIYWLADGFHRVEAQRANGATRLECEVRKGGRFDAIVFGVGANATHGLHRSNADKRHSVKTLFRALTEQGENWADNRIAKACGVGNHLVAEVRRQLGESPGSRPRKGSDGKERRSPKRAERKAKPRSVSEPPNAFVAIAGALDAAATRSDLDTAYTMLSRAAANGEVGAKESEELTSRYRAAMARIEASSAPPPPAGNVVPIRSPACGQQPWTEADALVDVRDALSDFTRQWRENAPTFDSLIREARIWADELEQKEARRHVR